MHVEPLPIKAEGGRLQHNNNAGLPGGAASHFILHARACSRTKQATLIAMLRAPDGATIEEIMAATGWRSHTVRGAMSGALKKKLGLEVNSEKVEDRGRVYRLPET